MNFIFLLPGIVMFGYFAWTLIRNRRFTKKGLRAKGVVSDVVGSYKNKKLFITFTDQAGNEINGYPENMKMGIAGHCVGSKIDIFYDADYPSSFIADPAFETTLSIFMLLIATMVLVLNFFLS